MKVELLKGDKTIYSVEYEDKKSAIEKAKELLNGFDFKNGADIIVRNGEFKYGIEDESDLCIL